MITTIIRLTLSIIMLYFIYGETGTFTTITMFFLMLNAELQAYTSTLKTKYDIADEILTKLEKER